MTISLYAMEPPAPTIPTDPNPTISEALKHIRCFVPIPAFPFGLTPCSAVGVAPLRGVDQAHIRIAFTTNEQQGLAPRRE